MSEKNTIARPYAKALFEIAYGENNLDQWCAFLEQVARVIKDPQMMQLLRHPQFSVQQSLDLIFELVQDATETMKQAIIYIAQQKRLAYMPQILDLFEKLKRESQKTLHATLISFEPLENKALEQKIIEALKLRFNREIILRHEVDDTLIGGAIIKVGDRLIDGSLKGRLKQLRDALGV